MEFDNIEKTLEKYQAGKTSQAEEAALKDYFSRSDLPPHMACYKPLFMYYSKAQQETSGAPLRLAKHPRVLPRNIAIAAIIVVLLGIFVNKQIASNQLGTSDNPKIAFREVSNSLKMISEKLNKGVATIGYLDEIKNTTNIIFKP